MPALPLDDAGTQTMSRLAFGGGEFLGSSRPERVKKCRQLAREADRLAASAINPELRKAYLDLRMQWHELADEMDQIEKRQTGE